MIASYVKDAISVMRMAALNYDTDAIDWTVVLSLQALLLRYQGLGGLNAYMNCLFITGTVQGSGASYLNVKCRRMQEGCAKFLAATMSRHYRERL